MLLTLKKHQVQTPAVREPVPFCGLGSDEDKTYRVVVHSMPQLWTLSSVWLYLESPPQCGHHCHQRTTAVLQWCLWSSVCHRSHTGVSEHSWRGSKHALKCVYPRHAEDGRSDLTGFQGRSLISRGNQHCPLYCLPTSYWGTTPQGIPI